MVFSDALTGYWLERRRDFSRNTFKDYSQSFRRFVEIVGDLEVESITSEHVNLFLNELTDRGLATKTVSNAWVALSSFWSWAEKELDVPHALRGQVKCPRVRRKPMKPYSQQEVEALVNACSSFNVWTAPSGRKVKTKRPTALRDRAIVIVFVDTGIRASELCDLNIEDYDAETGRLTILRGKGNKERVVYLSESSRKALWRYSVKRKSVHGSDPLFAARHGKRIGRDSLLRVMKRIGERAGVEHVTLHRFRHTFAVNFLRNGGHLLALQALLGHEKLDTVRIYARMAEVDLAAAQRTASVADNWGL